MPILDSPKSLTGYMILEVRESLEMVASLNAESGHASNKHAMTTQLIGNIDIEKQVLKLLEQDN